VVGAKLGVIIMASDSSWQFPLTVRVKEEDFVKMPD
jgi:hypothetical protein